MRRGRTRAERDAVTVEIAYAVLAGAVLAVAGFLAVAAPALLGAAHGQARKEFLAGATVLAAAVFCSWVARTLRRFDRENRLPWLNGTGAAGGDHRGGEAGGDGGPAGGGGADTAPAAHRVPHQRGKPGRAAGDGGPPRDQPSQPGRTSPDS
jgi:hypothetical protein